MEGRSFDLIVYGAHGFVGHLACDYINRNYTDIRWAIAGKDEGSLRQVIRDVKLKDNLPTFVAEAHDKHALMTMCSKTNVLLSVVGPYLKLGETVVEVCVETNTHYIDITGEPPFMRKMIDRHHSAA
jgi:short subunit dehydrogenase-like uncharacterized protein